MALGLAWKFLPGLEYLPTGNRNLVIGILLPPPGYSIEEILSMGKDIEDNLGKTFSTEAEMDGEAPPAE